MHVCMCVTPRLLAHREAPGFWCSCVSPPGYPLASSARLPAGRLIRRLESLLCQKHVVDAVWRIVQEMN